MSFEFFRNPFSKDDENSSIKYESLQDQLNASSNRKGLQYPIDLGTKDNQDFLLFSIYDTEPASFTSAESASQRAESGMTNLAAMQDAQNKYDASMQSLQDQASVPFVGFIGAVIQGFSPSNITAVSNFYKNQLDDPLQQARLKQDTIKTQSMMSKARFGNTTKRTMFSIALYMPSSGIVSSLGTNYKGESMAVAKMAAKGSGDIGEFAKNLVGMNSATEEGGAGFSTEAGSNESYYQEALIQWAIKMGAESGDGLAAILGTNLNSANAIHAKNRRILNPHMQFMFENVNQRSYEYSFVFTPRNVNESKMVHDIIRIFRIAAMPQYTKEGLTLDFPAEFDIEYFRGGVQNTWIPKISRCALTSVDVDFTPNSQVQHHEPIEFDDITGYHVSGPAPASVNVKLSFQELSTLVRQDIRESGY